MARLGCILIIGTIALLWGGGQKIYTGIINRTPASFPLADYEKAKPPAHWLKLTDCRLSVGEAMVRKDSSNSVAELFIPLRPPGPSSGKAQVLLATKDTGLLLVWAQVDSVRSEQQAIEVLTTHRDKLYNRQVQGLVRYGIDLKDKDRRELAKLGSTLASDFIILDDGEKPSLGLGLLMFFGGLLLGAATLFSAVRYQSAGANKV
jgi:hypothetical protein